MSRIVNQEQEGGVVTTRNDVFNWGNYDDNPLNSAPFNAIANQKDATWAQPAEMNVEDIELNGFNTFTSNGDDYAYPQSTPVIGEEAMNLVFGEGFVIPNTSQAVNPTIVEPQY